MESNLKGLCVDRGSNGRINSVQVSDMSDNIVWVTPEKYEALQIAPPLRALPDVEEY